MKLQEVKELTDQELQIRIAKHYGWTNLMLGYDWGGVKGVVGTVPNGYRSDLVWQHNFNPHNNLTPAYTQDLNATQELEIMLNPEDSKGLFRKYIKYLTLTSKILHHSSAREKSEAFLLTMENR
jgi:hypothetical protein